MWPRMVQTGGQHAGDKSPAVRSFDVPTRVITADGEVTAQSTNIPKETANEASPDHET